MNNFAEIIWVQKYRKVTYYSVSINDEDALYDQFIEQHTIKNSQKLNHILAWLEKIGNDIGAHENYFRNEAETGDARALPPIGKDRKPVYVEYSQIAKSYKNAPNDLRLYCYRANEAVVFLFNGDIKTKQYPQDCDNVRKHFKTANKLSKLLGQALTDRNIRWNDDWSDIIVDEGFKLEWD
ncbi:MAG: hypothetical protein WBA61_10235 [Aequorivita sp.]